MAPKAPRWVKWTLVYIVVTLPGLLLTHVIEGALHWSGLGADILLKLPLFVLGSYVAHRLVALPRPWKPQ